MSVYTDRYKSRKLQRLCPMCCSPNLETGYTFCRNCLKRQKLYNYRSLENRERRTAEAHQGQPRQGQAAAGPMAALRRVREPDNEWTGSQSKFNRYQDGIPRIYCACGTRVMLIRFVRRSGGAAGDQELYLYLQRNGLMNGNFCKLRLCWFCTRAEKITLDMVDRLAHSAGIAARAATSDAQRASRKPDTPTSNPRKRLACARKKSNRR